METLQGRKDELLARVSTLEGQRGTCFAHRQWEVIRIQSMEENIVQMKLVKRKQVS